MSSRRSSLKCLFALAIVAVLSIGFFRVQKSLLLIRSEDYYKYRTTTWDAIHTVSHNDTKQADPGSRSVIASSSLNSIPQATLNECFVEANRIRIHNNTKEWLDQSLPLFSSIQPTPIRWDEQQMAVNNTKDDDLYWTAHFSLVHLAWKRKQWEKRVRFPQWSYEKNGAIWYCDGRQALVVNQGCPRGNSLHIRCPQKSDETVSKITIYNYTYHVKDHVQCAIQHPLKKPPSAAKVAAAVMVYNMNLHIALEWIEYHRLIGIDHFFLYVLDEEFVGWPDLDYITYIPWNLNNNHQMLIKNMVGIFLFQPAAQMDAILRARALGLDWVAMNDMDEYLATRGNYTATSAIVSAADAADSMPPLKKYLADYIDPITDNDNDDQVSRIVAAIQGETMSFGKQPPFKNRTRLPLLLDYTWRLNKTWGKRQRNKCIVRPTHTEYHVIHWVSWPTHNHPQYTIHMADPWEEMWIQHYKLPVRGPFKGGMKNVEHVEDPFLRDMYASIVGERVNDIISRIQQ